MDYLHMDEGKYESENKSRSAYTYFEIIQIE